MGNFDGNGPGGGFRTGRSRAVYIGGSATRAIAGAGNRIVDQAGVPVQLRGMSLYWSQWIPKYYTANTVKWLRDDWKVTVVRAAMAVKRGKPSGILVRDELRARAPKRIDKATK